MDELILGNSFSEDMGYFHGSDDGLDNDFELDPCEPDFSDDDEEPQDPVPLVNTRALKENLSGWGILGRVKAVLRCMKEQGINVPLFLDALTQGDAECRTDAEVKYAGTLLMVSDKLPEILQRMYRPPRGRKDGKGRRPAGARRLLHEFATTCIIDCVDREMDNSSSLFLSPPEALNEDHLTSVNSINRDACWHKFRSHRLQHTIEIIT
ncbi:hypothetical protein DXG03_003710 [Asterophora parasitica]|uniref:Uncharacterized protein n=1 Tax=Asterophora parasitica TaxID=117018 RepID=A0A9P7GFW7_9AGAR|nr:hypothetical protein DXG03_003710 [Asterophora parasitica]